MSFWKDLINDTACLVELVKGLALITVAIILIGVGFGISVGSCLAIIKFFIGG